MWLKRLLKKCGELKMDLENIAAEDIEVLGYTVLESELSTGVSPVG